MQEPGGGLPPFKFTDDGLRTIQRHECRLSMGFGRCSAKEHHRPSTYNNLPVPTQQQMQQAQMQAQAQAQAQQAQAQQAQAQAQQAQKLAVPKQNKSEYQLIAERTAANLNKKDKITIVEEEPVVEESKKQELSDKELKTSDMKLIQQLDMNLLQDAEYIAREE